MKAVVLVGGQGTRLRPLTSTTPKQMLPVAGRPMIEWVVAHLSKHGVDEVILSLGYQPDAFLSAYPDGRCAGVRIRYAVEPEPLDTAGAIAFTARQALATISLTPVDDPSRYGVVAFDSDGRVTAFIEKPPQGTAPTNLINAGTYVLEPPMLVGIGAGQRVSIERATFPKLVAQGSLYALASAADWTDAGTVATYLGINLALARRHGSWVDATAGIDSSARVVDSVVAAGAEVGPGALVERALVMAGARIGAGATVRESIIGAGAIVGDAAKIEAHSVVGPGMAVAAGTVAIGARFPGDPL